MEHFHQVVLSIAAQCGRAGESPRAPRAQEAAGARHRVITSAIQAPPKPGSDPSGLGFLGKYRKGWTERPLLAQIPDGPVKAILRSATSSRVPSLPRPGPARATLSRGGGAGLGADGEGRPAYPPPPHPYPSPGRALTTFPCGQKCPSPQRRIPEAEAPSGKATFMPLGTPTRSWQSQPGPGSCHRRPVGCHAPGLSAVGARVG